MYKFSALAEEYNLLGPSLRPVSHVVHADSRTPATRTRVIPNLPVEIGFLGPDIISCELLEIAAAIAGTHNTSAEAVLLGEGWVSEDVYYQALARHCGVPYCNTPAQLISTASYPHSILAGSVEILPLKHAHWLLAPRGRAISRLIQLAGRTQNSVPPFEIATPRHLSSLVQRQRQSQQVQQASFSVVQSDASLSAFFDGLNLQPILLLAAIGFVTACCLWSSLAAAITAVVCGGIFGGAIFARLCGLVAAFQPPEAECKALLDSELPTYTIVVPLYDEAAVFPDLIAAIDRLDYPKSKLDIKLVVEACDSATRAAIGAQNLAARYDVIVAPDGKPRTKPRALNMGLHLARGELLVVFDAEDRPEPQQLRRAAANFSRKPWLACLQAQLAIDNISDSWLTRLFAVEYAALFDVVDPGMCNMGLPLPLGGTSNHFRTRVLRQVYGWDAWNVTEDADLGLRLARLGFEVRCLEATTLEEAPITLQAWLGQRQRWQKGWLQTIGTHLGQPWRFWRELGSFRALMCACTLMGMALGGLLWPLFVIALWRSVALERLLEPQTNLEIAASTLAVTLCIGGLAAGILPALVGMKRRGHLYLWPWLTLLPVYNILVTVAAWQGLIDLAKRPFHWQKTRHGVSTGRVVANISSEAHGQTHA